MMPWYSSLIMFIVFAKVRVIIGLSCAEVLELPPDKKLSLSELRTIEPRDIIECLAHLGKEPLPTEEADFLWQSIIKYHEGIENIPDTVLMVLHWVTVAIKPEDYGNLTIDSIDVVQNFGLNYNLHREQLAAIADRVREDYAGKKFEDYTYYDLMAMKQILCEFNRTEVESIHPVAYREAALMIGKLENCETEPMIGFATLAVDARAFGPPDQWTDATLKTMGKVAEYLPQDLIAQFKVRTSSNSNSG